MAAIPKTAAPCSRVELRIKCAHLADKDVTSKSDPCAVLYMQDKGKYYEVLYVVIIVLFFKK